MYPITKMVDFDCVKCHKALQIEEHKTANPVSCPSCLTEMTVRAGNPSAGGASNGQGSNANTVPVRFGIPKIAHFEGRVTKGDAGKMACTFLGGVLTLAGVVTCAVLGVNFSKKP